MALPINIKELVHGKVVEWERLEFKAGWNPEQILHSICAFANDINNWGGGYIIVGIEAIEGVPQFPPKGLPLNKLDEIQGELINICYKIQPNYLPIVQPYIIADKHILVIWAPAGDMRPYSGPSTLGDDARRQYYIRAGSRSLVAQGANLTRLMELTAKVPFDDRINQQAQLNDLDLGLIREFLQEVGSDLLDKDVIEVHDHLSKALVSKSVPKSVSKFLVIIDFMNEAKSRAEILNHIGLTNHTKNYNTFIKPLLNFKIIELTIPDKPNSRLQKYRLTQKGAKLLL